MTNWITKENISRENVIKMLTEWGFTGDSYDNNHYEYHKMSVRVPEDGILISNGTKYCFYVEFKSVDNISISYRKGANKDINLYVRLHSDRCKFGLDNFFASN